MPASDAKTTTKIKALKSVWLSPLDFLLGGILVGWLIYSWKLLSNSKNPLLFGPLALLFVNNMSVIGLIVPVTRLLKVKDDISMSCSTLTHFLISENTVFQS